MKKVFLMAFVAASVALASCSSEGSGNAASENTVGGVATPNVETTVDNGAPTSPNAGGEVTKADSPEGKDASGNAGDTKGKK